MKIQFDAKDIGLAFADASDQEQAAFFNEMGRALHMGVRDDWKREMQLCYLADKLDRNGEWLVKALTEFVNNKQGLNPAPPATPLT
jgi:hypothetical protein